MSSMLFRLAGVFVAFVMAMFALAPAGCNRTEPPTALDVPIPRVPTTTFSFPDSVTSSRGLPPRAADSTSVLLGDTVVQTALFATPPTGAAPMQLDLRVFVRDTSIGILRGRVLPLSTCPFSVRIYSSADRSASAVWSSDKAAPALRCPALQRYGASSTDVTAIWDVTAVLGDSLRAGRYTFAYSVRTADGRSFDFAAGSGYLTTRRASATRNLSRAQFSAKSEIVGDGPRMLRSVTMLKNAGPRPVTVSYGACNTNLRLYRTADRRGLPVWQSEFRKPPGSTMGYSCILPLYSSVIVPGDSMTFPISIPMYEVVADSLAAGRYYVTAELSLIDEDGSSGQRTTVHPISAGAIDITRDPDHLPGSRTVDGLTYTATTRLVHGLAGADTVRTLVLVANLTTVSHAASVSRDCPVIVYPYRSGTLRDSVPIQPPLSYPNPRCSGYPYPFSLAPGQSWVFGFNVPVAAARAALGAGHFWFTAWMSGSPSIMIAAGDIELPER